MKIGIITYHRAKNVGAMLQSFALQNILQDIYGDCDIIDYRCIQMENNYAYKRIWQVKGLKNKVKHILTYKKSKNYEEVRDDFIKKYYKLSSQKYDLYNIVDSNNIYDLFFTGSDQVWNTKLNYNDMTYFLDFVKDTRKKNSYAASFGSSKINENLEEISNQLMSFNAISVREVEGAKIVNDLINRKAKVVLDPTLLLSKEKWNSLLKSNYIPRKKYIFIYIVAPEHKLVEKAKEIAKKEHLQIICFNNSRRKFCGVKNINQLSPQDFINYINHAEYVLTTSFHGFCFSVIMNKNFYYELDINKNNNNSRLITLARALKLDNRNIDNLDINNLKKINYLNVNKLLNIERKKSLDFIKHVGGNNE